MLPYLSNVSIAPKLKATSAGHKIFFCHLYQVVVVYTFPPHYSRGVTYATPKFGIAYVIIEM